MTRKILVPLDGSPGSEGAVGDVERLARAERAVVRLLAVMPPAEAQVVDGHVVAYADQVAAQATHAARTYLGRVAATLAGIEVELAVAFGDPAEEIGRDAEHAGVDLIAMATHRRSGLQRLLKGSVAEQVERTTTIPVLLVSHRARQIA
jgi:nucleotide-binding universal stress UspA family protein